MSNTCSFEEIRSAVIRLTAEAAVVVGRLEPRDVPVSEMPALLDLFVTLERKVAAGRVLCAARAAEAAEWKREGFASAAEWLASRQGTSTGQAKDVLNTSTRLEGLDDTAGALRDGRLSPEQADAVSGAASANPAAEKDLLDQAERDSLKNLRDEAARRAAEVEDLEKKKRRIARRRSCRSWVDRDGAWNLRARGPIEAGAAFDAEFERWINDQFNKGRLGGHHETRDNYAFDALINLATHTPTDAGPHSGDGDGDGDGGGSGSDGGSRSPGAPRRPRRENLYHLALLRVDALALQRGSLESGEVCEIAGLGPVALSSARDVLGDAIVKLVITRGVDVLNVTHLGRGPSVAQTVASLWSQPICVVDGCNRTRRLETDHREPWADTRVTELSNLDRLCDHHHTLKTHDGWALVRGKGRRAMVPPRDPRHPSHAPPGSPGPPGDPPGPGATPADAGSTRGAPTLFDADV